MQKPLMRIPYTGPLPPPLIIPRSANTLTGAISALQAFLTPSRSTLLLTGAGISVASGLADYRGTAGTYTLNKTYQPTYYSEFVSSHEARKRYWARSYLGWTNMQGAKPNKAHEAIKTLGGMGLVREVVTQNVDSLHNQAHPNLPTLELHGFLRSVVCVHCRRYQPREEFQKALAKLNPQWASFLDEMMESGALTTEDPVERRRRGLKTNPDGDVDVPDAPYTTFRYPPCPSCLLSPPKMADGSVGKVFHDDDGAMYSTSTVGVLKPAVIMFGESIAESVKDAAEMAVDGADRVLVIGTSLATYSAWRLVKKAKERGKPIAIVNLGGVRGEEAFFADMKSLNSGELGMRCSESAEKVLPFIVQALQAQGHRLMTAKGSDGTI